ncbi:type II toxin-antitoxin system HicB family antitoxin [Oscillospiraceae bacterium 50-58]
MNSMLEYKGYHAKIEFDAEDMIFVGEVFGVRDSLNFHGKSIDELTEMFHQTIDNYLELCAELGRQPDKEFKGSFNVRIAPALHRQAALKAEQGHMTLNQYVEKAIESAVSETKGGEFYILSDRPLKAVCQKWTDGEILRSDSFYQVPGRQYRLRGELFDAKPC